MYEQNRSVSNTENSLIINALIEKSGKNNSMWGAEYIVMAKEVIKKDELKKMIESMLLMRALGI